jgi:hypothetical protein
MVCNCGLYYLYRIGISRVVDLTYKVGITPHNLRSQEKDQGVPRARAADGRPGRGRGEAGGGRV